MVVVASGRMFSYRNSSPGSTSSYAAGSLAAYENQALQKRQRQYHDTVPILLLIKTEVALN